MAQIISVAHGKGGVGKTTFCVQLGFFAAENGIRTLFVDIDDQGSLTLLADVNNKHAFKSIYNLIHDEVEPTLLSIRENLDLIPANDDLTKFDRDDSMDAYFKLRDKLLERYNDQYDLIIIDTPGNLGARIVMALVASKGCIAPMEVHEYSVVPTEKLINVIHKVIKLFNPNLEFLGVVFNKFKPARKKEQDLKEQLIKAFGEFSCLGKMGDRGAIANSVTSKMPVWEYKTSSNRIDKIASEEVKSICKNIFSKLKLTLIER